MTAPKVNRNKVLVTTSLTPVVHQRLSQLSDSTGIPRNALIEQALNHLFLAQDGAKKNATPDEEVALG